MGSVMSMRASAKPSSCCGSTCCTRTLARGYCPPLSSIPSNTNSSSMGAPAVVADVVEGECCHGMGRPPFETEVGHA